MGVVAPLTPSNALVQIGPTLLVDIGFDPAVFGQVLPAGSFPQIAPMQNVAALVDTGASHSCIDEQLAQRLQLPLVNQQHIAGVGGMTVLNVYLAHVAIPSLGTSQYGLFSGAHLARGGQHHEAIVGRTLLQGMMMIYDGISGSVKLVI